MVKSTDVTTIDLPSGDHAGVDWWRSKLRARSSFSSPPFRFVVTNSALGGDPAVGYDKILIVVYRYQGTETATAVREGNMLSLP